MEMLKTVSSYKSGAGVVSGPLHSAQLVSVGFGGQEHHFLINSYHNHVKEVALNPTS